MIHLFVVCHYLLPGYYVPEIKRRIALGWAAFSKVANIMKSRKASMNVKRKVHNEYVLPVMVYGRVLHLPGLGPRAGPQPMGRARLQ